MKEKEIEKLCEKYCEFVDESFLEALKDAEIEKYFELVDNNSIRASMIELLSRKEILEVDSELHKAEIEFLLKSSLSEAKKQKLREFKAQFEKISSN